MKKLIYFLVLAPLFILVSCKTEPQLHDAMPGVVMHNLIDGQNGFALEPVSIAYKLNILLNEALAADVELDDKAGLEALTVKPDGYVNKTNLRKLLFPYSSEINVVGNGVYEIIMDGKNSDAELSYDGKIKIDTQGELLDELSVEKGWIISVLPQKQNKFTYTYSGLETEKITVSSDVEYGIFHGGEPYSWDIKVQGHNAISSLLSNKAGSDWSGEYTFKRSKGTDRLTLEGSHASKFTLEGGAEGVVIAGYKMKYEIVDPLIYGSCEKIYTKYLIESGEIDIEMTGNYETSEFPAPKATTRWSKAKNSCNTNYTVLYNNSQYIVVY